MKLKKRQTKKNEIKKKAASEMEKSKEAFIQIVDENADERESPIEGNLYLESLNGNNLAFVFFQINFFMQLNVISYPHCLLWFNIRGTHFRP